MPDLVSTAIAAVFGLVMLGAAALTFSSSPYEALFLAGLGSIVLGIGGVARVSIPAAAITGSAGFVMLMVAVFGSHFLG